ncbi:hypothetical protein D9758_009887 [Tetrapyrgos nigripes]|uniref:Uncharacterized protein n=1 Tax=Tetrapyrgos nigripes TaxID=182062 RepID=A0A8H5LRV2_9AGAR|nr:hypothetical protein D9758_009887 [Tetrapyrgos nigripes]
MPTLPDEEYDIDLGAESHKSLLHEDIAVDPGSQSPTSLPSASSDHSHSDGWKAAGIAVHTAVPSRSRNWHSHLFSQKLKEDQEKQKKVQMQKVKGIGGGG